MNRVISGKDSTKNFCSVLSLSCCLSSNRVKKKRHLHFYFIRHVVVPLLWYVSENLCHRWSSSIPFFWGESTFQEWFPSKLFHRKSSKIQISVLSFEEKYMCTIRKQVFFAQLSPCFFFVGNSGLLWTWWLNIIILTY